MNKRLSTASNPVFSATSGFNLIEALIALAVAGLLATFVIPKFFQSSTNQQTTALIQDSYTTLGEMYLAREQATSVILGNNTHTYAAPAIGTAGEQLVFAQYLYDNLRRSATPLAADASGNLTIGAATLCTTEADYFTLQDGCIVRQICSPGVDSTGAVVVAAATHPNTLSIKMRVPVQNGASTMDYLISVPESGATGKSTGRYSTVYGYKLDNSIAPKLTDCTFADQVLKIVNQCP